MAHVLVVEDEPELALLVRREFEAVGHCVTVAIDGPGAVEAATASAPDIIVLDIMLPGFDGLDVIRRVRAERSTPILLLTARGTELDRVVGLELGADDYLVKPFSMRELQARVGAILRRSERIREHSQPREAADILRFAGLEIDVSAHEARTRNQRIALTATEFSLLRLLASNPGRVFSREFLLEEVWGDEVAVFDRTLDSHIRRLRKKLGGTDSPGDYIETVWGVGYRFSSRARMSADRRRSRRSSLRARMRTSIRTRLMVSHLVTVTISTFVYASGGFLLFVALLWANGYRPSNARQNLLQFSGLTIFTLIQIALITLAGVVVVRATAVANGAAVEDEVRDTGVGIPEDKLPHIFDRFYTGDSTREGGSGLGLSIVKHVVDIQGGSVRVESVVDEGTTFIVRLPAATPVSGPVTGKLETRSAAA